MIPSARPLTSRRSASGPTVLIRPDGTPANDLARALADAFGADAISTQCAAKLRAAGLDVEVDEPRPIHRAFKRVPSP